MNVLHGKDFLTVLKDLGAVPAHARRVVIDADMTDIVHVYYEGYGDPRLLSIEGLSRVKDAIAVHVEELPDQ
jgi:hypothetical protein